jgi:hypothetical protein
MKRIVLAAIFALLASQAFAQWQVPNNSVPIGRGPGVVGFNAVAPVINGQCLTVVGGVWASAECGAGTGITTPCAIGTLVAGGGVGEIPLCKDVATNAQMLAGTSDKFIQAGVLWQAETTTTYGTTTTFDFATFKNTAVTLTGDITTQTLSNVTVGKAGSITFIQDGSGNHTTVWNSIFKFSGGTAPTLTTTAAAIDILSYSCRSATFCQAALMNDVK